MSTGLLSPSMGSTAPGTYDLGDVPSSRDRLFSSVLSAAQRVPAVANQKYSLQLSNVGYEGPETFTKRERKRAIIEGRTLGRRLRGDWTMTDVASGQPVDQRRITLGTVPYMADDGTFLLNGNEYSMAHQMRLRPGVFTRAKESGEIESHVNVARGFGHRYLLDPETGVFRAQFGQSKLPLLPILRALGASDTQIRKAWGRDLYAANMKKDDPGALKKLAQKLKRQGVNLADPASVRQVIMDEFAKMELDPEVSQRTLGQTYDKVDVNAILAATAKLLRVHKGEEDGDDRDSMLFQRTVSPADIFAERLEKNLGEVRRMLWKSTFPGKIKATPGMYDKVLRGSLMDTGLGNSLEEINPGELLDQRNRITRMGEGGISSLDAIPDASRAVQPSHLGFLDPIHSPESAKIGVDLRIATNTKLGDDGRMYSQFIDKRGNKVWRSPQDLADSTVAFPGEMASNEPFVRAISNGKNRYVPRAKVDYELNHMTEAFGPLANMVPLKGNAFGQRVSMGARFLTQALPLVNAEAPLVQAGKPGGGSFEAEYGTQMGAVRSDIDGTVVEVNPGEIKIRGKDRRIHSVELDENMPFNRKTFRHNTPTVKPGQMVASGDLLARSNFTDEKGVTALGLNARVAYLAYKGFNFEDAIVVSEGFAKRSASEHMYQNDLDLEDGLSPGLNKFLSIFPGKITRENRGKYDDDGVILPGTEVNLEDPLVLAVKQRTSGPKIGRRSRSFADASIKWDHHAPGVVTDVFKGKKGINVIVKSTKPTQVGDKFSGRFGDKGVIAKIVSDDEMPQGADGRPFEVLLNPLGVISRGNPAQILEAALGKIAAKTGKPYQLPDFDNREDMVEFVERELRRNGMDDLEDIFDPGENRKIASVAAGSRFMMKLHHTSESKLQGRATGGYSSEDAPAKGGDASAKRLGLLELNAMLSHGAFDAIREGTQVRGQKNEDYWRQVMSGYSPPEPDIPLVYKKFVSQLKAAGINPVRQGTKMNIMAMTANDVDSLAGGRELRSVETVDWKDPQLKPVRGGLFDPTLTGGHSGNRWSYIKLQEPMANPVMEEPVRRILGMTEKEYRETIAGKINCEPGGKCGPTRLAEMLDNIDLDREIDKARAEMNGGRKTYRDAAIRRLGFLKAAKKNGQHPREWMLDKVPVLPPQFRAVNRLSGSGTPLVADANFLYKEVWEANQSLRDMTDRVDDVGDERLSLYDAFKGVVGLGDPIQPQHKEQKVRGILKEIFGSSPKYSTVQRKLLGSTVDLVGRGTVTPNPNLDMDQLGIPVEQAWTVYSPFVIGQLVRKGMPKLQAVEAVKNRTSVAKNVLTAEMDRRPVVMTRAPVLHRFGVMAFHPVLTNSSTVEVPPLVTGGFGMDFDGDAVNVHVMSTDAAIQDAEEKMLPSKNLLSISAFDVHYQPSQEYLGGLWAASSKKDERMTKTYETKLDALRAYRRGEIGVGQRIAIDKP